MLDFLELYKLAKDYTDYVETNYTEVSNFQKMLDINDVMEYRRETLHDESEIAKIMLVGNEAMMKEGALVSAIKRDLAQDILDSIDELDKGLKYVEENHYDTLKNIAERYTFKKDDDIPKAMHNEDSCCGSCNHDKECRDADDILTMIINSKYEGW